MNYPQLPALGASPRDVARAVNHLLNTTIIAGGTATWGGITGSISGQADLQTALNGKEPAIAAATSADYFRGDKTFATLNKAAVGLANVDNTSDLAKPISTATQAGLDAAVSFTANGTGAVTRTTQDKLHDAVSVFDFATPSQQAAIVAGTSTNDSAILQAAINASAGKIHLPKGTYKLPNGATAGLLVSAANLQIVGDGPENTKIVYTSSVAGIPAILVSANGVKFADLTVDARACSTNTGTGTAANCGVVKFAGVNEGTADNVTVLGGHYGIWFDNTSGDYSANKNHRATNCRTRYTASSGIHAISTTGLQLIGNDTQYSGTDGIKLGGGTRAATVTGNYSAHNDRDGMDTYDGLIECTVSGNVAEYNGLQGFEFKGTFGGSYSAGDYVVRGSTIANNVAAYNGTVSASSGFAIHSARNSNIDGNVSIGNSASGYELNDLQGIDFSGNGAYRNTQHGFDLAASVTRTLMVGNSAIDNSWAGGTVQNGTYNGFHVRSGCGAQFTGNQALNGATAGKVGGQGYGIYFDTGATGSSVASCYTLSNVTGGIGGFAGWTTNNKVSNVWSNGVFEGLSFNDAFTTLSGDLDLTLSRAGNATYTASRTSGASAFVQAQSASGIVGTSTNHPLRLSTNGTARWEATISGHFLPISDNVFDLGSASQRARAIYAGTGTFTGALGASNLSGTNTGDETKTTIDTKLALPSDGTKFYAGDGTWKLPGSSTAWGGITGTLSSQTDLQTALDGKAATVHTHTMSQVTDLPTISSGTYTPTLTNTTNVAASTAYACQWLRVGNTVTVSGKVDIDPTTASIQTELRMTLPVTVNNFTAIEQACGVGAAGNAATLTYGIFALVGAKTVRFGGFPSSNANVAIYFTLTYQVV